MEKTIETLLIAVTSTPTVTNTQISSPAASTIDITSLVITAAISAILSSSVVGTALKIYSDNRFAKQQREHDEKMAERAQELKTKHERELEVERQQRIGRKELVDTWESLLNNAEYGTWILTEDATYPALESYFSEEFKAKIAPYIGFSAMNKMGIIQQREISIESNYLYSGDDYFRGLLKQELARLKREWGLL